MKKLDNMFAVNFKLPTDGRDVFNRLQLIATYYGKTHHQVLFEMIQDYVKLNDPGIELITEAEAITELRSKGFRDNRTKLSQWRNRGVVDGMWYTNDSGVVIYDRAKFMEFAEFRGMNRYKRLPRVLPSTQTAEDNAEATA